MENEDTQELNVTEIMRALDRGLEQCLDDLTSYLSSGVDHGASDLFIVAGGPVSVKIDGRISAVGDGKVLPPQTEGLITQIYRLAGRSMSGYQSRGDDDFSFALPGLARFRVNTYRQRGSMAAVIELT